MKPKRKHFDIVRWMWIMDGIQEILLNTEKSKSFDLVNNNKQLWQKSYKKNSWDSLIFYKRLCEQQKEIPSANDISLIKRS